MTEHNQTYPRTEKLKSRKLIQELFAKGKSVSAAPIKCLFLIQPEGMTELIQTGVGVSARNFRKSVQRNRIKRMLREAYRNNNQSLHQALSQKQQSLAVFMLYLGKDLPEWNELQTAVKSALEKVQKAL
ncbi:MAG: ribonuclease P protein component [Sediminibacterium sp.]|nr:ribonuclease P protein component [Sediminibacterium sp.]